ncbi:dUTP pyrophosphatase [Enterococcus saccharolyticus]|uniref:dUTP diphosphatase n=1 Tax=Enterococcus saccharolyticus subsp. saccharolyticus ATCC 43076 TaxID=1139996 RepID=S0JCE8_9ENTE|nr:dUTP pyrophosphatase [Enterococcus saccharolyticus]EOT26260.1 dUTP pyrophosphatase [Enterococcus saccharolyticus subsp. saccharolyticus ATCC 43076]EOT82793.1 dUTP pyrophosphatase [Enterococcus saccharolyticus subsp. saccharolyticus ATCC 43076]
MKKRGFERVTSFEGQNINLPVRATNHAAGYDFEAAADVVIPSIWKQFFSRKVGDNQTLEKKIKPVLVPTGIKAYMGDDEFLQLANRSSNPLKRFLILSNGVGVIDSDYYNNASTEGHIMFQFTNVGLRDVTIKKGERIGQGIFLPFLKADQDETTGERTGGFGSSDK